MTIETKHRTSRFCRCCDDWVLADGQTLSGGAGCVHGLLIFCTLGLWTPVALLAWWSASCWRCRRCGGKV